MTTTHLFNAMTGVDHRHPGLAVAALADDAVFVELIADGNHVHPSLWPLVTRTKPADRLVLVSDALPLAGDARGAGLHRRARVSTFVGGRATLVGTNTLAGSTSRSTRRSATSCAKGQPLSRAVLAASANPASMLGVTDRGRLESGRRAHVVELDDDLRVRRVTRGEGWIEGAAARS